jgi:hypothetical protein
MTTQLIPFDPSKLAVSLANLSQGRVAPAALFMKMGKDGSWVYGVEGEEIEEGAEFMINPQGFQRGFICWKHIPEGSKEQAKKLGEVMVSADAALEEPVDVPEGGKVWNFQLGIHLKGMDDGTGSAGKDFVFRTTSVGGVRAVDNLAQLMGAHYAQDGTSNDVAVVSLSNDSYKHVSYGKIYNPILTIERWINTPKAKSAPKQIEKKKVEKKIEKKTAKRR